MLSDFDLKGHILSLRTIFGSHGHDMTPKSPRSWCRAFRKSDVFDQKRLHRDWVWSTL